MKPRHRVGGKEHTGQTQGEAGARLGELGGRDAERTLRVEERDCGGQPSRREEDEQTLLGAICHLPPHPHSRVPASQLSQGCQAGSSWPAWELGQA